MAACSGVGGAERWGKPSDAQSGGGVRRVARTALCTLVTAGACHGRVGAALARGAHRFGRGGAHRILQLCTGRGHPDRARGPGHGRPVRSPLLVADAVEAVAGGGREGRPT